MNARQSNLTEVTSFSVLFRNLLPSEELVAFSRALFRSVVKVTGMERGREVVLSIERPPHARGDFVVALIVDGSVRGRAAGQSARQAILPLLLGLGQRSASSTPAHRPLRRASRISRGCP